MQHLDIESIVKSHFEVLDDLEVLKDFPIPLISVFPGSIELDFYPKEPLECLPSRIGTSVRYLEIELISACTVVFEQMDIGEWDIGEWDITNTESHLRVKEDMAYIDRTRVTLDFCA